MTSSTGVRVAPGRELLKRATWQLSSEMDRRRTSGARRSCCDKSTDCDGQRPLLAGAVNPIITLVATRAWLTHCCRCRCYEVNICGTANAGGVEVCRKEISTNAWQWSFPGELRQAAWSAIQPGMPWVPRHGRQMKSQLKIKRKLLSETLLRNSESLSRNSECDFVSELMDKTAKDHCVSQISSMNVLLSSIHMVEEWQVPLHFHSSAHFIVPRTANVE